MDERIITSLDTINDFKSLGQLEKNARKQDKFDTEAATAFTQRAATIARRMISQRTGLDLSQLTPAEEKIVHAVSEYIAIKKRAGSNAGRTLNQLRNRGLIEAAEKAVSRSKPTQGFKVLHENDLEELSYERIVIAHPEEFSPRAIWYSRRALGLPNLSVKPPARHFIPAQIRTEELLNWLAERAKKRDGLIEPFQNSEAARVLGMADLSRHGRVFGNIQSRIDFACYRTGLPPLGLTAANAFKNAWLQENRDWSFPVESMQRAARQHRWSREQFERLVAESRSLPGQAHLFWKSEISEREDSVRVWAEQFGNQQHDAETLPVTTFEELQEFMGRSGARLDSAGRLAELERNSLRVSPKIKKQVSIAIERGPIGQVIKRINGFRCQICEALGQDPIGFKKRNGEPYVESHHVMPVSLGQVGSLSATNIITLCPNHHREVHFGNVEVRIDQDRFLFTLSGRPVAIPRTKIADDANS